MQREREGDGNQYNMSRRLLSVPGGIQGHSGMLGIELKRMPFDCFCNWIVRYTKKIR